MEELLNQSLLGLYRHFKGGIYRVTAIATHTENDGKYVVYYKVDEPSQILVRPYDMFFSNINKHVNPDATQIERFKQIKEG